MILNIDQSQGIHHGIILMHLKGVLVNLQRVFMETDSESKREWLKQFMRDTPCNTCNGKKLKPEALAVKINE